jgi:DNA-binding beta-propeller fold protein YncE
MQHSRAANWPAATGVAALLLGALAAMGAGNRETTLITPPFSHDLGFHRASKFYLDMYLGRSFKFAEPEGLACVKLRIEDDTTTSMDDHVLTLFGVNSGTGQILYNLGMRKLSVFGKQGAGDGEFNHPHGVAAHRQGAVYVADTDNDRIVRLQYLPSGLQFVKAIPSFSHPYGVAIDSRGVVYVTDSDHDQVAVLDTGGNVRARWDGLAHPTGIAVLDGEANYNFNRDDFVAVIENRGQRLSKFSTQGERLASIDARDIGLLSAEFAYCAIDLYGSIYVTDRLNDQVHKFDQDLNYLASFGRTGSSEGQFHAPRGIGIGRQFGQVFIAEEEGGQYYWIGLDAFFIGCYPDVMTKDQPGTTIALYVTEMSELTINIMDKTNKLVRGLYQSQTRQKPGELLMVWDGKDNAGVPVPSGEYIVQAILKPTYGGQRRSFKKELTAKVRRV